VAGVRQKHADRLAFRRGGRGDVTGPVVPLRLRAEAWPVPKGLCAEAVIVFEETMKLASDRILPSDFFAVRRWAGWVNRWLREMEAFENEDSVTSGAVSDVVNPRLRALMLIEGKIAEAEQAMGLDPRARMRLGISFAQEQEALTTLKASREGRRPVRACSVGSARRPCAKLQEVSERHRERPERRTRKGTALV
jgi:hypothetical protein